MWIIVALIWYPAAVLAVSMIISREIKEDWRE